MPHNAIDVHVGARLKQARIARGWTQEKLGAAIGITFQQIQKYETGANRIGASRLYDLGQVLGRKVDWFFEEMSDAVAAASPRSGLAPPETEAADPFRSREALELGRNYLAIPSERSRLRLLRLVQSLAADAESAEAVGAQAATR